MYSNLRNMLTKFEDIIYKMIFLDILYVKVIFDEKRQIKIIKIIITTRRLVQMGENYD